MQLFKGLPALGYDVDLTRGRVDQVSRGDTSRDEIAHKSR